MHVIIVDEILFLPTKFVPFLRVVGGRCSRLCCPMAPDVLWLFWTAGLGRLDDGAAALGLLGDAYSTASGEWLANDGCPSR
jgi:hypothetical protein